MMATGRRRAQRALAVAWVIAGVAGFVAAPRARRASSPPRGGAAVGGKVVAGRVVVRGATEMEVADELTYETLVRAGVDFSFLEEAQSGVISSVVASYMDRKETFPGEARVEVDAAESRLRRLVLQRVRRGPPLVKKSNEKRAKRRALAYARLASWSGGGCESDKWVRPLDEWTYKEEEATTKKQTLDDLEDAVLESLTRYVLETYETAPALRCCVWLPLEGDANRAQRTAWAFFSAYRDVAAGDLNVRRALQARGLHVTKTAAKLFSEVGDTTVAAFAGGPLHLWRRSVAQAVSEEEKEDDDDWVGEGACRSVLGSSIEPDLEEFFSADAMPWVARNAEALAEPSTVAATLDYFREMRRTDPKYTCAGRTPKSIAQAVEAVALSTVKFDDDEAFLPNPRGLRPMLTVDATIPPKTQVRVPYDDAFNGGHGTYTLGPGADRGARPHTVRVEEVLSLRRLIYEGKMLNNCLETRYESQVKYVTRARARASSFWSFTIAAEDAKPKHVLLLEVWHLPQGNIVRQAEGPRPRTLPPPEAWYWASVWCKQNKVDLSTWDHYSRLEAIIPSPPYC